MSAPDVAAAAAVAPLAPQGRRHAAKLAPLFRPLPQGKIGHLPAGLRNRVIFPPCTRWVTPGGLPASAPDSMAEYYANRAAHCGLVVTEGLYMDVPGSSPHPDATTVMQGECMEQWREVCDAVHAVGGLIAPQIHHVGIQRRSEPEDPSISPSGISMKGKPVRGLEPMTLEQIAAVQDEYIATAQRCADVGFDGIAIHSAHGVRWRRFLDLFVALSVSLTLKASIASICSTSSSGPPPTTAPTSTAARPRIAAGFCTRSSAGSALRCGGRTARPS